MNGPLAPAQPTTPTCGAALNLKSSAPPLAFTPMSRIHALPRSTTSLPRPLDRPLDLDMKAPPSLTLKENIGNTANRAEKLLTNLVENPEYGDFAKTVVTNLATSVEIGKFVHSTLKDFNLASTLTGNGIMAMVIGSAVVIGGNHIAQKMPGSAAALNAKTEYCLKKLTEELEMRQRISQKLGDASAETSLIPGTTEFDAAVEVCVQELRTVPSTNNLTLGKLREFIQDIFAHIQSIISLFRGNNNNNNANAS